MEKVIAIAFAKNGSNDAFKRLNLLESVQKATFGRKSLMDFCFVSLEKKYGNVWVSPEGQEFHHYSDGGVVYFVPYAPMPIGDSGRLMESAVLLNDFVKYLQLLVAAMTNGRWMRGNKYYQNWASNITSQYKLIGEHLKKEYNVDIGGTEEKDESPKVIIVRDAEDATDKTPQMAADLAKVSPVLLVAD